MVGTWRQYVAVLDGRQIAQATCTSPEYFGKKFVHLLPVGETVMVTTMIRFEDGREDKPLFTRPMTRLA